MSPPESGVVPPPALQPPVGPLRLRRAGLLRRYAVAWAFLGVYLVVDLVYSLLGPHAHAAVTAWASTSVTNLEHDPVGSLVASAFISGGSFLSWPLVIALAMFGANRVAGNMGTAVICLTGHVVGSLVSEGIVAYRVDSGLLPVSFRHLTDVGPSYVIMSAVVIGLLAGNWPVRACALLDLALLVFFGHVFSGLGSLEVAAVGHVTAAATAAAGTLAILLWRRQAARGPSTAPAGVP